MAWGAVVIVASTGMSFVAPAAIASTGATPIGELVPSGTGEALGPAAVSGADVFVGAPDSTLHVQDQGAVLVFAKPASGWAGSQSEVATLTASDANSGDRLGNSVAVAGSDVVVGSAAGKLYVFAPPAGGWSGELHQVAVLSASDGAKLGAPVVSGQTIVAKGTADNAPGAVYVFSEPDGGWSGTLHESARLSASDGTAGDGLGASIAVSGSTIVAGAPLAKVGSDYPGAVYVFTEPAAGWSGPQHETAKLTGSDVSSHGGLVPFAPYFGSTVAISGSTIVAGLPPGPGIGNGAAYVFTESAGGWSSESQAAKLVAPDGTISTGSPLEGSPSLGISADTIVVPGWQGSNPTHPAEFVFTKPTGGWSGTQGEAATLIASDGGALGSPAISGQNVIAGGLAGASDQTLVGTGPVYVFTEPAGGWAGTLADSAKLADQAGGPPTGAEDLYSEPATGWSSGPPSAALVPSGDPRLVSFASVAASGPVAVADQQGSAYVFTQPSGGWTTDQPSAMLTDPAAQLGEVTISGSTIAALAAPGSDTIYGATQAPAIDVFAEPGSGWSATVAPVARLVPSDGAELLALAIDGPTIVAAGVSRNQNAAYVFTEPAGGWAGVINETARLPLPRGTYPGSVSLEGTDVAVNGTLAGSAVAARDQAYVFTEPATGWHGIVPVSATLTPGYYDGTVKVYREPARGWTGVVHPAARLMISATGMDASELAASGGTIAVTAFTVPGKYDSCPCAGGVWLFSPPAAGWAGTLTAPEFVPALTGSDGQIPVAVNPSVLFIGGQAIPMSQDTALDLFSVPAQVDESRVRLGKPSAHTPKLTGLADRKPRLSFTLRAGTNAPPIGSLTITLPRGLRFAARKLHAGVLVDSGPARGARIRKGKLTIPVAFPAGELTVTLRRPAVVESDSLLQRIGRIRHAGRRRHPVKLEFRSAVDVTDASGTRTRLPVRMAFVVPRR